MSYFNIVATTNENTVVTEYIPVKEREDSYQSESALEREFIHLLMEQGYESLPAHREQDLILNLRQKLEELNNYHFSDRDWNNFFRNNIANNNEGIKEKTKKIQEDHIQVLKCEDGTIKNIYLIDKKNIHKNSLQVINQYEVTQADGAKYNNRYDVTILVNGLPLVHVELKRRGVQLREAFNQIERYQRDSFVAGAGLFEYVQIFVISNGTYTKYYSNSTRYSAIKEREHESNKKKVKTSNSFEFTCYWADAHNTIIADLVDFTKTFFARHTLLNILTKYCVFTADENLLVMRPYQITATERILNRIEIANNYKKYGNIAGGGYVWHTTGSGKTLTSFKTAKLASQLPYIDKVLFVVDRKDLDYQTMKEYDRFEKGAANSNTSTAILKKQLEDKNTRIIITTIQKLSNFISKNKGHSAFDLHVVIIFDECHRSQFGDMHQAIIKNFKKYHLFGFTGTPIFAPNAGTMKLSPKKNALKYTSEEDTTQKIKFITTPQTFGDQLHAYTIVNAIDDGNVLPFHVEYHKTMEMEDDIMDEEVKDIDRKKAFEAPERVALVTQYILEHFNQKTYRNKTYNYNTLTNITDVANGKRGAVKEKKENRKMIGFNSIFAVSSVPMAKLYYQEFKKQMRDNPRFNYRIAIIYSYGANEAEADGILDEENPESTSALDQNSRDFLESAIQDYNEMFQTNYDTSSEKFQNYYKDVSLRMKNREIDMLIVVNMFLTGFDATTLNTLWVDKNLKMHGLIQAFSRTNRILNSVKTFGNVICFRNLQKPVNEAIALFGNKNASGIVLLKTFKEYYKGYIDDKGKAIPGYVDIVDELLERFPLSEPTITGEQNQKDFIALFGDLLRRRNLLLPFDEFKGKERLSQRDFQNYSGRYNDLYSKWKKYRQYNENTDILDDIVFEIELIKQIDINIDYILALVDQYHSSNCENKEVLLTITSAIDSSFKLRSKKALIENFIALLNEIEDPMEEWPRYIRRESERELSEIITSERLKEEETRKYISNVFRDGELKTSGTYLNDLLPPMKRFGGNSNREETKKRVIQKFNTLFDRFFGISDFVFNEQKYIDYMNIISNDSFEAIAEDVTAYGKE